MERLRGLNVYACFCSLFAFFVIFAGAMVTSTDSGMAVPDWPQSFGVWMPRMVGGVFYEHGHRMVAGLAGLMTLGLALWAAAKEQRRWARMLCWSALVAVVVQAGLGGLTVLMATYHGWDRTSPLVSTLHASLAQAFFGVLLAYAIVTSPGWLAKTRRVKPAAALLAASKAVAALVYLQIVLGAVMRHQEAGLIISDFPLSYGKLVPEFHNWLVALNYAHRLGAFLLVVLSLGLAWPALKGRLDPWAGQAVWALLLSVAIQFTLGAYTVWSGLNPLLASLHVIGGAMVFVCSLALALRLERCGLGAA